MSTNFLLGQAKMATHVSRKKKLGESLNPAAILIYKRMLKARLKKDFSFFVLSSNAVYFKKV